MFRQCSRPLLLEHFCPFRCFWPHRALCRSWRGKLFRKICEVIIKSYIYSKHGFDPLTFRLKFVQKSAGRHLLVNAFVCTISFGLSLPVALALFPQQAKIHRKDLEPELQDKTNDEFVYFNKGL